MAAQEKSAARTPSRIHAQIAALNQQGKKAFIPFVVAGDPNLDFTAKAIRCLAESGSAVCEIGFPYSDPIADGPVIQAAYGRALNQGVKLRAIFDMLANVLPEVPIPCVAMVSAAIIRRAGLETFLADATKARLAGLIVPDLPLEEAEEFAAQCQNHGMDWIPLVTPTTSLARGRKIVQSASGFVYYVAVTGITGERASVSAGLAERMAELRAQVDVPICVGFGISQPQQAAQMAPYADGIIVGSAIVRRIAEAPSEMKALDELRSFARAMVESLGP
jgi:tryptophan synthase alpha chain